MKISKRMLAYGAVAVLLMGGLAMVAMLPNASADDSTPVVEVSGDTTSATYNLTMTVMNKVRGEMTPVGGANVTVCRMNLTYEGNETVMTVENVTVGVTDENGTVTFVLPEGKYFVFAENNGKRGFAHVNLDEDQARLMKMHHWNWGHMRGEKFQYMSQECEQNGTCDGDQTQSRTMKKDRSGDMDQDRLQKRDGSC